jgi:hypothetical protein
VTIKKVKTLTFHIFVLNYKFRESKKLYLLLEVMNLNCLEYIQYSEYDNIIQEVA